jgi:hypothetical protein
MNVMADTELEMASRYSDQARARLLELQEQARLVLSQHPELAPTRRPDVKTDELHSCTTKVIFTGAAIWERVQVCNESDPPTRCTSDVRGLSFAFAGSSGGRPGGSSPRAGYPTSPCPTWACR